MMNKYKSVTGLCNEMSNGDLRNQGERYFVF